ncbi:TlpA family protein disulfide reductase [Pontibacter chitinilyticus]|uniref:TlpA family protein disulfide reductase n=1 Tax=Pontibacter chitinilyticus TaxID=2674989 RepID=UPI00321C3ACC
MKKIYFLYLPALLLLAQAALAQDKALITGKIAKPLSEEVVLALHPNPMLPEEVELTAVLQNGEFRLEVPLTGAIVAELQHGDEVVPVYLEPGSQLHLTCNGDKFLKTIRYEGKGANENNYLAQYTRRFDEVEDYQVLPDNIKLKEKEFTAFLDYRRQDQLKNLDKYGAQHPIAATFRDLAVAEIDFSYASDKITYEPLREHILMTERLEKPSAAFYAFLDKLDVNKPENLLSPAFIGFLRNYVAYYTQEAGYTQSSKPYYKASYDVAAQKLQGRARALAQAYVLEQSIQKGYLPYTEEMLQDFGGHYPDAAVNAYFTKLYDAHKQFAIGSLAPDLQLQDVNGDSVALRSFKGKLVYLSFWRTDCGLCMVEQPHLQDLTNRMKGKGLVFVNISLDKDENAWRKAVTSRGLEGEQLYLKDTDGALAQQYGLQEMPAYFLLDEEGRFLSITARRPTDHELVTDIQRYLNTGQASATK